MLARHGRRLLHLLDDSPVVPGDERAPYVHGAQARQILNDAEDDLKDWQPEIDDHSHETAHQREHSVDDKYSSPGQSPTYVTAGREHKHQSRQTAGSSDGEGEAAADINPATTHQGTPKSAPELEIAKQDGVSIAVALEHFSEARIC